MGCEKKKMLRMTMWAVVGVLGLGFASCSIICPDGRSCPDSFTCCKTKRGYACCGYPNAVCCEDLVHCCPSGYRCNLVTQMCEPQDQPWMTVPMLKKVAAEDLNIPVVPLSTHQEFNRAHVPDQTEEKKSSVVHCDSYYYCPDGMTCCRIPTGGWACCPYSPARCCADGYHCCPYGYNCDPSYQYCVSQGLRYPFISKQAPPSIPALSILTSEDKGNLQETLMTSLTEASSSADEAGVIRCDSDFYCPEGMSCCKGEAGQWSCCPYRLGQCCPDRKHCCQYGYTCDPSSLTCRNMYSQIPSGQREPAKQD
ncbi:hypothetical protein LDENG_00253240 [Lucifuga dentata]|nr:hypothetical protein LDENG_00253240 [Lucifuga dentata]